ncbi:MAG: glutamate--tRNA ligase [Acidimicrobiaceae bacterium]|nr:glutamate--tRNA ligase [Acidimicrobiaceae bacterium]MCY4175594.1 glutamate--tRNA ligase [Acidimicrobiaceae bacterium]MCY4280807.1 glutamate--tRNA ligase [Acidimicrobiaceae bacterium]MCY4295003.1 glutamate--tRNA ligase [Acidimicrobiaceae bacterium]
MTAPRVRFAPAPTGFLHVGSARTALFNWLYARHHGGEMVLRIEDTDAALKTQQYVDAIVEPLRWLGLDWDEGPHFQSERRQAHQAAVERLLSRGAAYFCDLTRGEIKQRCEQAGLPLGYHGWSRDRGVADGPGVVVRFRCPDQGETVVDDAVRGRVSFPNESLEDFVIRRGDGSPTFHLANAMDDHDMAISHVIRGEDLLNTTPRVLLLWQALGYGAPPRYAHLPLLVNAKRQKLSKRRDDVSLDDYRRRGCLPEAMVNHLALLGWGPPDAAEIRPLDEIVELFDLDAVKPSPAFFDPARLDHINSVYIKALTPEQFADRALPHVCGIAAADASGTSAAAETVDAACEDGTALTAAATTREAHQQRAHEVLLKLAGDLQQRVAALDEVWQWIDWILSDEVAYDDKAWQKSVVKGRAAAEVLGAVEARLAEDDFTSAERLEAVVMGVGDELSERLGVRVRSQAPVRAAVSGRAAGLPLWEPLKLLGKDEVLARIRQARSRL